MARKKEATVVITRKRGTRIIRGNVLIDIDGDRRKDSITFYKRKRARGHVANVNLSSTTKKKKTSNQNKRSQKKINRNNRLNRRKKINRNNRLNRRKKSNRSSKPNLLSR